MRLDDFEKAMLAGEMGVAARWALEGQIRVGEFFDAEDFVEVCQTHISADMEAVGEAGLALLDRLARLAPLDRRVRTLAVTEQAGVDHEALRRLGHDLAMFEPQARLFEHLERLGVIPAHGYVNFHSIMPPAFGESTAFGSTPVCIYANSVQGARCNFEGGPAAVAVAFTGRVPRYGFHLDRCRRGSHFFVVEERPGAPADWSILGALIGERLGSYWRVPVIEGVDGRPSAVELNNLGAAMATFGSLAMFHVIGVTPEARDRADTFDGPAPEPVLVGRADIDAKYASYGGRGDRLDVVVFGAPQLHYQELADIAERLEGRRIHKDTALLAFTSEVVKRQCDQCGVTERIEEAGGLIVRGMEFFALYPRELARARGWKRMMTNSAKLCQIVIGYGYAPVPAPLERCIDSAISGKVL